MTHAALRNFLSTLAVVASTIPAISFAQLPGNNPANPNKSAQPEKEKLPTPQVGASANNQSSQGTKTNQPSSNQATNNQSNDQSKSDQSADKNQRSNQPAHQLNQSNQSNQENQARNQNAQSQQNQGNQQFQQSQDRSQSADQNRSEDRAADRANSSNRADNQSNRADNAQSSRQSDSRQSSDALRSDSRQDQSGAQRHSTFRASDLRGPDIGLWFDRHARDGLVISDVSSKGAISKLGFREGDRVVSVNGHRVNREADFIDYLLTDPQATRVAVVVTRDGRDETIYVEPATLIDEYSYAETDPLEQFGVVLDDRYDDRIVVWRVIPRSPAYYAGLRSGDVLVNFHDRPLTTRQDFEKTVTGLEPGEADIQIRRGERTRNLSIDVPRFNERSERRTAMRPNYGVERGNDQSATRQSDNRSSDQQTDNRQNDDRRQDRREDRGSPLNPFRGNR
jgi:C-terminal processing protease CtpA/Prc